MLDRLWFKVDRFEISELNKTTSWMNPVARTLVDRDQELVNSLHNKEVVTSDKQQQWLETRQTSILPP
jgi:hypothetical protein